MKKNVKLYCLVCIVLLLLLAGCNSTDPNADIIEDIKSNYIKSEAAVSVEENEIIVDLAVSNEEDNGEAYTRMLSVAQEIKSKYNDKTITINLLRDGSSFGVINL